MAALTGTLLLNGILVGTYYNRFWYPPDEGMYAHIAERVLAGETLHRDVQDIHPGYIDFANAAAFSLFGTRLVSLRYPLAFLSIVQSALAFLLLQPRGLLTAAAGAIALTSLSFIQFLDPSANWYCLFLTVATVAWLRWVPQDRRYRDVVAGALVGMTFLFRQVSGVLLGMGVLVWLLLERRAQEDSGARGLGRALALVLAAGLALYLAKASALFGWLLLGVWPLLLLVFALRRMDATNRVVVRMLFSLGAGAVLAAVPLVTYQAVRGAVTEWLQDSFGTAVSFSNSPVLQAPGYGLIARTAIQNLVQGDVPARLNGAFWLVLLSLGAPLGWIVVRSVDRRPRGDQLHPLPVVAVFYSVVALHYQIPIYLFFVAGLSAMALLWHAGRVGAWRGPAALGALALSAVAIYYQAAMPLSRGISGMVAGARQPVTTGLLPDRGGLRVGAEDAARYLRLVGLIERETRPGDTILALPSDAELYFLSRRVNPFRFANAALGIRSKASLDSALRLVRCHPPALVLHNPEDKYNTAATARLMDVVRTAYEILEPVPPLLIYRRPNGAGKATPRRPSCDP